MDTAQYLPMFLAEAREHLQELNLAVVRVEETPDDRETVDEIFRIAHSFKGMSATMGFEGIAAVTHRMEDVFELLKQRSGGLDRVAIDVLLECLDTLEAAVDSIEADGTEQLDPAPLVARLQALIRAPEPEAETAPDGPDLAAILAAAGEQRIVQVTVGLAEDCLMPSVRAYMVLAALAEHGELAGSEPHHDDVESFEGAEIVAYLASEHEDEAVLATVLGVPDVGTATAVEQAAPAAAEVAAAAPAAAPAPAAEVAEVAEPADAVEVAEPVAAVEAPEPVAAAPAAAEPEAARPAAHGKKASATVRVDAERLDHLMHAMGELVVHRTLVESLAAHADVPGLSQAMQELTRSSQALQAMVMQVRMIPVDAVFMRFPRLVRDLSSKLGKDVELKLVGKDTELDRTVVEALGDPLVHLIRNSLDHGLEGPEDRAAAGKPKIGTLEISARHAGGNVVIEVRDDGRGVDPARVGRRAVDRGLITAEQAAALDSKGAAELLFAPGFSTAEVTSDISGRGVGMDAVRTIIRELGGEVTLNSEFGQGTTAQIRLPLTLAIMAALLVEAGGQPYAIPLDRVERTLRLADQTVRSVAGQRMLVLRDGVLPVLDGADALGGVGVGAGDAEHAVIVRGQDRRLALAVSRLVGQRELVTRPLPAGVADRAAVSGGAVLSDGRIALIVDCDAVDSSGADRAPRIAA
jgi:two-component system, chemotaxis family, sensor kinase CheA